MLVVSNPIARRAIVAASFGNAMEWYDFSVYAYFASYIARNFFVTDNPTSALINTFIVFGTGFLARPIGAVCIGMYGDRVGRKSALMLAIMTMGAGTVVLALAPPAVYIGIAAPILLVVGRLLQGFSAGGEIGGAAAFLIEHSPTDQSARYSSWLQASMGASNLISAIVGLGITTLFSDAAINNWVWRVPFLLGILILPLGVYIRRQLPETEAFERRHAACEPVRSPLLVLLLEQPQRLVTGFLFSVLWTVSVYAFVIYAPTYYKDPCTGLGFTPQQSFLASLVGNVILVIGCLLAGWTADRVGKQRVVVAGSLALLVMPVPCLFWLHLQATLPVLLVVHSLLCAAVAAFAGVAPAVLPRLFPVTVRSTGVSLSYNFAAIFFAGFTPALMTWAITQITIYAPALWVSLGAVVCLAAVGPLFRQIREVSEQEAKVSVSGA